MVLNGNNTLSDRHMHDLSGIVYDVVRVLSTLYSTIVHDLLAAVKT